MLARIQRLELPFVLRVRPVHIATLELQCLSLVMRVCIRHKEPTDVKYVLPATSALMHRFHQPYVPQAAILIFKLPSASSVQKDHFVWQVRLNRLNVPRVPTQGRELGFARHVLKVIIVCLGL